jgi:hypothetical protein
MNLRACKENKCVKHEYISVKGHIPYSHFC